MNSAQYNKAYSLIELSIVITIISVLSVICFDIYQILKVKYKYDQLEEKFKVIEDSLLKYYRRNHVLPLPDSFLDDKSKRNICNITSFREKDGWFFYQDIIIGSVPVTELNLTYDYKFDNFYNKILYVINKNLACSQASYDKTNLIIKDRALQNITDDAIYLLISLAKDFNITELSKKDDFNYYNLAKENYDMDNIFISSLINNKNNYGQMRFKNRALFFIDLSLEKKLNNNIKINSYLSDLSCKCLNYSYLSKINNIVKSFCVQ